MVKIPGALTLVILKLAAWISGRCNRGWNGQLSLRIELIPVRSMFMRLVITNGPDIMLRYAQDDFKVTPKLTINMGLRYDLYRPTVDKWNHLAWVDRTVPNPALGGFPGTMVFATPDRRTGS